MTYPIASKLPAAGVSIFAKMTALANRFQAINLAQGFPDFSPPEQLFEYLQEAVHLGFNQYAPMPGLPLLRQQIQGRLERRYGFVCNPETDITVTAGATQAIYTLISAFVRPGDKVVIFEPAYDSYGPAVLVNGGEPVYLRLELPDFTIPWQALEKTLQSNSIRMILVNNPHNPAGRILSEDDLLRFQQLASRHDVLMVWDEVYDMLVFDGNNHCSALQFPTLMEQSIVCYSMGKTLHNTGWKIGYTVAREELTREIRKVHQFLVFSVNTPAQYAIGKFMDQHPDFMDQLPDFYQAKRDVFLKIMDVTGMHFLPCEGSYFAIAQIPSSEPLSDIAYAEKMVEEFQVATIPVSAFYHDGYDPRLIRFCFAKKQETIEAAAANWKRKSKA